MINGMDLPERINELSLFSGGAGLTLALEPWVETIAYCELDQYARSVLLSRMAEGRIPEAPIWDNIRTLRGKYLQTPVHIITAGFPCQDISVAGTGEGLEGDRSGLVFEVLRLVCELMPDYVFLENSPALSTRGLDRILLEFDALGYDVRWTVVSAAEMGAPHLRERIFLLAHINSHGIRIKSDRLAGSDGPTVAEPNCEAGGADFPLSKQETGRTA